MTNLNKQTTLFEDMSAAQRAWNENVLDLDLLYKMEAAERAYSVRLSEKQLKWNALPNGAAKDSAEQNAFDTEGTYDDILFWHEIALSTYEMNIDCGYFPNPINQEASHDNR